MTRSGKGRQARSQKVKIIANKTAYKNNKHEEVPSEEASERRRI